MGTSDVLLNADIGQCSQCDTKYVVSAGILADDSHITISETYACPNCKKDQPKDIERTEEFSSDPFQFADEQLRKRLTHMQKKNHGLEILTSETC